MSGASLTRRDRDKKWGRSTGDTHLFQLHPFQGTVLEVEDIHFHHDSPVFLPNYAATAAQDADKPSVGLGVVAEALREASRSEHKVLVAGHADTTGPDGYNLGISLQRAKAFRHVALGERPDFVALAVQKHKTEDVQLILKWVAATYGWDCDPGGVDDASGPLTQGAIKRFKERYNVEFEAKIAENSAIDADLWGAIFDVYQDMLANLTDSDEEGLAELRSGFVSRLHGPGVVGCGERFPIEEPRRQNYRSRINRRVEVMFFEEGHEPRMDCHPGGPACKSTLCEVYNPKIYKFDHLPIPAGVAHGNRVFLRLAYLDPEKNKRAFPKDFPVRIVYQDGTTQDEKVGDDGALRFGATRGKGSFTVRFEAAEPVYVAVAPDGSSDPNPNRTAAQADLAALHTAGFRFFATPRQWALRISNWKVDESPFYQGAPDFQFLIPTRLGRSVGNRSKPIEAVLDPSWSFVRFEFFDRTFGHSDHGHKRANVPAFLIDARRDAADSADPPDIRSHWTILDDDPAKSVHAIPWIVQRKDDQTAEPKPDPTSQFEFATDANSFVSSRSATERVVEVVTDANRLLPGVDRLKLYDLPARWRSKKYLARFADNTTASWDSIAQARLDDSKAPEKPIGFSLDDIVLVDATLNPITLAATEDPCIFFHQFKDPGAGFADKAISAAGVYSPGADITKPYFPYSDIQMPTRHHITDYPNWVRLVVAQGNLFDVFDRRTPDGDRIVGARAAVRWVDASPAALGIPTTGANARVLSPRPARTDQPPGHPSFSLQPYFEQKYGNTRVVARSSGKYEEWKTPHAPPNDWQIGRFDMGLLRDCDVVGGKEQVVNLHYFRFAMNFSNPPTTPPGFNAQNFRRDTLANIPKRWNGPDAPGNPKPAKLLPDDASVPVEARIFWFVQDVPANREHYAIQVIQIDRAFMQARDGTGSFGPTDSAPHASGAIAGWFTAAHECGHGDSLLDEYNERWSLSSYTMRSFATWIPGDPYERDEASDGSQSAIMLANQDVRPRHLWHAPEWVRVVTGIAFHLDVDGKVYRLPQHPTTAPALRTYVTWPYWAEVGVSGTLPTGEGGRRRFDMYLYTLGNEPYARMLVAGQDLRGLLLVEVKLFVAFDDPNVKYSDIESALNDISGDIDTFFNRRLVATSATIPGTPVDFSPCYVQFTPRFLVQTFPTNLGNNAEKARLRTYFNDHTIQSGGATAVCPKADPARTTYLTNTAPGLYTTNVNSVRSGQPEHFRVNLRPSYTSGWVSGGSDNRLRLKDSPQRGQQMINFFGDMLGLDMTPATLAPDVYKNRVRDRIVRRVFPSANLL